MSAHRNRPEESGWFLQEAKRNLALLRKVFGARSKRYRRLLRTYRDVADELGRRRELERFAHVLRRRPLRSMKRWRPRRRRVYLDPHAPPGGPEPRVPSKSPRHAAPAASPPLRGLMDGSRWGR